MNLRKLISEKRLIAPLMGNPGARFIGKDLNEMVTNLDIHVKAILKLNEMFKPDLIFMMMDLSIEAEALGLEVFFAWNESPTVKAHPVKDEESLNALNWENFFKSKRVKNYIKTAKILKEKLNVPLIAYVIGPFTLAGLLMGASQIAMETIDNPEFVSKTVKKCSELIQEYSKKLQAAGADSIVILEPTATFLSPNSFWKFSGTYIKEIVDKGEIENLILHICGNTTRLLKEMERTGASGLSLDSDVDFSEASNVLKEETIIIGNINPVAFQNENRETISKLTKDLISKMKDRKNFILSTGCDLPYNSTERNIREFFKAYEECIK